MVNAAAGLCGSNVVFSVSAGDNCGVVSTNQVAGLPSGALFPVGVTTNIFVATDAAGNSNSCTFTVTVRDATPPSIICAPNVVVSANAGCSATNVALGVPVATNDNCGILTVTNNGTALYPMGYPLGTNLVTWTVTDTSGNSNSCVQWVIVRDTTPPLLTCASNKTVECGSLWSFDRPTALDACCGTNVTVSLVGSNSTVLSPCQTLWQGLWQATDCCSNSTVCTQLVLVVDTTPPLLTCASNKTVECGSAWSFDPPAASDACSGTNVTVTLVEVVTNGVCPAVMTATWKAVDACGNTTTCSQVVTNIVPPPQLAVSPASLEFGLISTGALAQASFIVSNAGVASLQGSAMLGGPFAILSGTPFTLDQSVSTNLIIQFTPTIPGLFSNVVVFTGNGGNSTNPVTGRAVGTISLLLQGTVGANFSFSFNTVAGLAYHIQYKDDLNDAVWQVLQTVSGDGTIKTVTNSLSVVSQRFYRLSVE